MGTLRGGWGCGLFVAAGRVDFAWQLSLWTFRVGWVCGFFRGDSQCGLFVATGGVNFSWQLEVWTFPGTKV